MLKNANFRLFIYRLNIALSCEHKVMKEWWSMLFFPRKNQIFHFIFQQYSGMVCYLCLSIYLCIYLSIHLSVYIYCVTLIAEYYAQGCLEESQDISWHSPDMPVKPQPNHIHSNGFFFAYKYFVPGWTRTHMEEVCSSVVKYSTLQCMCLLV